MTRRPTGVKTILLTAAALLAAATLTACGDQDSTATAKDHAAATTVSLSDLDGKVFASVRVDGHRLIDTTQVQLGFSGDQISAQAGCNQLSGAVAVRNGALTTRHLVGTDIGCPDGRNKQDAWLSGFLASGPDATLSGDTLTLTKGGVTMELAQQPSSDATTGNPSQSTVVEAP